MVEISEKDYEYFQTLRRVFSHLYPELSGQPFLTGVSEPDETGFPKYVHICLEHGMAYSTTYKKV